MEEIGGILVILVASMAFFGFIGGIIFTVVVVGALAVTFLLFG